MMGLIVTVLALLAAGGWAEAFAARRDVIEARRETLATLERWRDFLHDLNAEEAP